MSDPFKELLDPIDHRVIQRAFVRWVAVREEARLPQVELKPALRTFLAKTKGRVFHRDMAIGMDRSRRLSAAGATAFEIGSRLTDADEPTVHMARCASYVDNLSVEQATYIAVGVTQNALADADPSTSALQAAMMIHDFIDVGPDDETTAYFAHYICWSLSRYPGLVELVPDSSSMISIWRMVHLQADPTGVLGGEPSPEEKPVEEEAGGDDRPTTMTEEEAFAMVLPLAWLDSRSQGIGAGPLTPADQSFSSSQPDAVLPLSREAGEAQIMRAKLVANGVGIGSLSDCSRARVLKLAQTLELEHGEEGAKRFADRTHMALKDADAEQRQLWMGIRAFIDLEKAVRTGRRFDITHPLRRIRYLNDGTGLRAVHAGGASISYNQAVSRVRPDARVGG